MLKYIIIMQKEGVIKARTSITKICELHKQENFSYYYLKGKKFPFKYKGWEFSKVAIER